MSARESGCAICGRRFDRAAVASSAAAVKAADPFPFCSTRCQMIDLGRWLGEEYRIPDQPDTSGGSVEAPPKPDDN